jgi:uncharacterized protein
VTELHRAYSLLNVKGVSDNKSVVIVEGVASTPKPDRERDIVEPLGARFETPMPFMLHHDSRLPVGNVTFARPTSTGIPFQAELPIVKEAGIVQDRVNEAIHSLKYKLIGCVSIGFAAVEGAVERLKSGGLRFMEWQWLELSLVTVPANPDAVITGIKSIDAALRGAQIKSADQLSLAAIGDQRKTVVRLSGGNPIPGVSGSRRKGVVYLS